MTSAMRRVTSWSVVVLVAMASCVEIPFVSETFAGEILVSGPEGPLTVGDSARLGASALFNVAASDQVYRHSSFAFPRDYAWKALNPGVATVDTLGVVRGIAVGAAGISTTFRTVTDTVGVEVVPLVDAVAVTPTSAIVAVNDTVSFEVTALDAQQQPLVSIPMQATPSNTIVSGGFVSSTGATKRFKYVSKGRGEFTITVKVPNHRADRVRQATFTMTVNP